jgi:hypothetical protein
MDGGELLARVHSVVPDRGIRHQLEPPDERFIARAARVAARAFGPAAAAVVERGADLLREEVMTRPAPRLSLAHGDWLPKHLLIDETIVALGAHAHRRVVIELTAVHPMAWLAPRCTASTSDRVPELRRPLEEHPPPASRDVLTISWSPTRSR